MLKRRGYNVSILSETDWFFKIKGAVAYFEEKITRETLKLIVSNYKEGDLVVIVHSKQITPDAKDTISKLTNICTFTYDEMGYDLIERVPAHSLVSGEKHKEWKKFPSLLSSDIVSRYYGFKKGDIVRIEECDGTLSHRKCV